MRQVTRRSSRKVKNLLAFSAAVGLVAGTAFPASAANLTWVPGDGAWVNGGGNFGGPVWNNATPDAFIHNSATRSQITLNSVAEPDLQAAFLQNFNGGVLHMDMGSLAITAGDNRVGSGSGAAGAFYQGGGAVSIGGSGTLRVGMDNGYGYYELNGGSLSMGSGAIYIGRTPTSNIPATGAFYQSDGSVTTQGPVEVSNSSGGGSRGVYYMTGGTYTYTGTSNQGVFSVAGNAASAHAQLTISGPAKMDLGAGQLSIGGGTQAGQTSIVNINAGGELQAGRLQSSGSEATQARYLNINNGTVRYAGAASDNTGHFLAADANLTAVNIYQGGAIFDVTQSTAVMTLSRPLVAPVGGGLSATTVVVPEADRGEGYIGAPLVQIDVAGASAVANMEEDESGNGTFRVASITITSPGINATGTPTYSFIGGGATTAATGGNLAIASNVSGGVTKKGNGILRFNAANTYAGETRIEQGSLHLLAPGDLSASSAINVLEGATFNTTAKVGAVIQGLKGAGEVQSRNDGAVANHLLVKNLLAPGDDGIGTLTISNGDLRVGDGLVYEYEIGGTTEATISDRIDLTLPFTFGDGSDLTFEGAWTLKLFNLGTVDPTGKTFVLFDYTDVAHPDLLLPDLTPNWTVDHGTTGWSGGLITVDTEARQVILSEVVPEPSALALLGLAALPMLRRRRM